MLDTEATEAPANEEGRHLSWFRVFLVVAVVAALVAGGWYWFR